ncbi:MAG: UDP-N-acetylglucosamine 2-epimerase (non-hydrolyzing) [Candidatus Omnitrophica bacterium]|nr:UDP-N-acetylglucosamine 2-epimerase (non-hydrolyzing) [Candidatus Omnitrophota bacterium]
MSKIKVMTILGTRPEVIKLAPVAHELAKHKKQIKSLIVLTGQHRKMVDQFLQLFKIKPDYDLDIMLKNQTLIDVSCRCLARLSKVLEKEKPNLILVEGDTTTAFIASLAAFYLKIPMGHVEAGLRTFDKYRPFPEEINRQMMTLIADMHFAPTKKARQNLLNEKIEPNKIFLTGNPVIDALQYVARKKKIINCEIKRIDFKHKKVILVTAHRRESFGQPFAQICQAIQQIAALPQVEIIYPVHLNPNVQTPVNKMLKGLKNVHLLKPLDYQSFVHVLRNCYLVLSDSGGVQEEAPAFNKPILVMREVTERQEGLEAGVAKLVGMDTANIVSQVNLLLSSDSAYLQMSKSASPYGDGSAAKRIVQAILKQYLPENQVL